MKTLTRALALTIVLLFASTATAVADGHGLTSTSVQIDNTIESQAFGYTTETPFGSQGPRAINDTIEFPECCDGFYAVNLTDDQITMNWVGPDDFERVIEPGTFDRYYFTFGDPVLAGASLAPNATLPANLTVVSPTELVVEVGPGMQIGDDFVAVIDVQLLGDGPAELAFTGTSTWLLTIAGTAVLAAGMMLVVGSRKLRSI